MNVIASVMAVFLVTAMAVTPASANGPYVETPILEAKVASGALPPVAERLPETPAVRNLAEAGREPGVHGGTMRMIFTRAKDVRYFAAYGYARLVGYDRNYDLVPDLLERVDTSEDGRSVTLHLRPGHKWSDGAPFTAEDFRYWWEDVALNEELSPSGPPVEMLVMGKRPEFEVLSETAVRYSWAEPNPHFLPALARARPVYIYRPAHYMKMFHGDYVDEASLAEVIEAAGVRNWAALHNRKDNLYRFDNPDLPILQPWVNTTPKNNQRYELARNPFFHRVDENGRQLPYIDRVEVEIAAAGLVPLKTTNGETTLQTRSLGFSDAPVLKRASKDAGYRVELWRSGAASEIAIYPNLNYPDAVWQELFRDARFRRALSLAVSRKAINKVLYFGLAEERAVAALEESPFFNEAHATAYAELDLDEANRLLDEIGLDRRNAAGIRLLHDGRPAEIVIETAGERREEQDALELITATWKQVGIRLLIKPLDRNILYNRSYAGYPMMVAWFGWNNGIPTADAAPDELAPVNQSTFSWPLWGQHYETKGELGEAPDMPAATKLLKLHRAWSTANSREERAEIWREMLAIHAEEVFVIGTVARVPMPVVSDLRLRNVPGDAIFAWDPGAKFGIHRIDEFWLAPEGTGADAADADSGPADRAEAAGDAPS